MCLHTHMTHACEYAYVRIHLDGEMDKMDRDMIPLFDVEHMTPLFNVEHTSYIMKMQI